LAGVHWVFQYDGRLFRSLRALLLHPGQLTRDHFDGKRERYVAPFQLFVLFNVAGWLITPYAHVGGFTIILGQQISLFRDFWARALPWRAAKLGLSIDQFSQHAASVIPAQNKLAILCLVPMFALGTAAVLSGRKYRFVQHLVFTTHFYCIYLASILFTWGLVIGPIYFYLTEHQVGPLGQSVGRWLSFPWVQHLAVAPALIPYLFFSLRRAYGLSSLGAAWRALVLGLWAATLSRAFTDIAFALVLIFTR
jgi:hypothetical protein